MLPTVVYLSFLAICLWVLSAVNHQFLLQLIHVVARLTGSLQAAITVYFLIVYPGIFVHEAAHWIIALLLGMSPSAFSVWPEFDGYSLRLGYVQMRRSDLLSESLVGAAPLLASLLLIALISQQVFAMNHLIDAFDSQGIWAGMAAVGANIFRLDRLLWLYLLFALTNGMMLSGSDREPLGPILGFALFAIITFIAMGLPTGPITQLFGAIFPALESLVTSLLLILFLDIAALVGIGTISIFVAPAR